MYVDCFEGRFFGAFPGSDCTLGHCYFAGAGVEQDLAKARYWWERAAGEGDREAKENLIRHFGHSPADLSLHPYEILKNAINSGHFEEYLPLLAEDVFFASIEGEEPIIGKTELAKHLESVAEQRIRGNDWVRARVCRLLGAAEGLADWNKADWGNYCIRMAYRDLERTILLSGEDPQVKKFLIVDGFNFLVEELPRPEYLTREGLLRYGIDIVGEELEQEGYVVDGANYNLGVFPNLVVTRDGCWYFVQVEAEITPFRGGPVPFCWPMRRSGSSLRGWCWWRRRGS